MPDNPTDRPGTETTTDEAEKAKSKGPANWNRYALDFEHPDEETNLPAGEAAAIAQRWNKGEVGEQFPDGHHSPDATDEELRTSSGGLSGGGGNSGGGERFGNTDR